MRGLYGQNEGNEKRTTTAQFGDRIVENDIAEGEHVAILRRMVSQKNWQAVTDYTNKLRKWGNSQARVDSMVSRSMAGLRF